MIRMCGHADEQCRQQREDEGLHEADENLKQIESCSQQDRRGRHVVTLEHDDQPKKHENGERFQNMKKLWIFQM
mgnify:CR=1 FL=1